MRALAGVVRGRAGVARRRRGAAGFRQPGRRGAQQEPRGADRPRRHAAAAQRRRRRRRSVPEEYLSSLGSRLATQVNNGDFNFNFFVVNDDRINAFALPGGYIGVNSGLVLASETESELAGVLAHEISHVTQRHIARAAYDNQRNSIMSMAAMLAALVLGAASDMSGDAMTGIVSASQALAAQRQINFTRSNEHEADRVGIELLSGAGFDPYGMSTLLREARPPLRRVVAVRARAVAHASRLERDASPKRATARGSCPRRRTRAARPMR